MSLEEIVWSGVIGAVIGVLAAFILQHRAERKQNNAIRTLIKIDIEKNLHAINHICMEIRKVGLLDDIGNIVDDEEKYYRFADKLVGLTVINWKQDTWLDKTYLFAIALSVNEIKKIESFYSDLEMITSIHSRLRSINEQGEKVRIVNTSESSEILKKFAFSMVAADEWKKFADCVIIIKEKGNYLVSKL